MSLVARYRLNVCLPPPPEIRRNYLVTPPPTPPCSAHLSPLLAGEKVRHSGRLIAHSHRGRRGLPVDEKSGVRAYHAPEDRGGLAFRGGGAAGRERGGGFPAKRRCVRGRGCFVPVSKVRGLFLCVCARVCMCERAREVGIKRRGCFFLLFLQGVLGRNSMVQAERWEGGCRGGEAG